MKTLPKFTLPEVQWGRHKILIGILLVVIVIVAVGGNFVYRKPDAATAKRFARLLPYPAAFVGWGIVWTNEVFAQERFTSTYGQKTNQVIPEPPKIRSEILDHLIEIRLAGAEAARHKVRVSSEEVDQSFQTLADQNGGREKIIATLKELYGMNEAAFKELLTDQLLLEKFKREVLVTVSVRHILVKDPTRANDLTKQVKEGADFAQLAKEQSEDTGSRETGGSLGFIGRGTTVKPFEDVAFTLQPGQISDPIQSEFGWHIIKVEEKKGIIDKSYADWLAEAKQKTRIVKLLTR